ncbi:MAG TPA: AbrB family transcriptional regulator [Beijerinckiaceae bacterium]
MLQEVRSSLLAAAICTAGGTAFYLLHAPLPWMTGSLAAAALTAILGGRWFMPAPARVAVRPLVGVLTGSTFGAGTLAGLLQWWDAIVVVVGLSVVMTLLGYAFFRTVARWDKQTAFFAAVPGGIGEMAVLGDLLGGNVRTIVVSHLMRILLIVFAVPFIAQWVVGHPIGRILPTSPSATPPTVVDWAILTVCAIGGYAVARALKFQGGLVIFPMLLSVAVHATGVTEAVPPPWLVTLAQIVVGGVVGARFAEIKWREMQHTIICAGLWAAALLAMAAISAWASGFVVGRPFLTMLLALAPAGMVEMTILTLSIGFDVMFVVTCQVSRILFVLLLGPALSNLVTAGQLRTAARAPVARSEMTIAPVPSSRDPGT